MKKGSKKEQFQAITFQKDPNGKIIFYEVVATDTVPRDTLWKNAKAWMKSLLTEKDDKIISEEYLYGTIEAKTSFMVYTPSIITKIPHGRVYYDVSVDVKDKKYRYTFTNFVFQPYKQDRSFKYIPVKGNYRPFEKEKYFGSQSVWNSHRYNTKARVQAQILNLKSEIVKINKPKKEQPKADVMQPVIKTTDW